jgi:hypothetical protein
VDASNTGRGTTVLTYEQRRDQLVERIKMRLKKIDRLNDIKGVRNGSVSADLGWEQAMLADDRRELRQLQQEAGVHVAS